MIEGDTRSLDYSSYSVDKQVENGKSNRNRYYIVVYRGYMSYFNY